MTIRGFKDEYRFLSNFWPAPVWYDGYLYPTTEHAYQAAKSLLPEEREKIRLCEKPGQTKRIGRTLTIRPDWEDVKILVMQELVWQKFSRHPHLLNLLLKTGDAEIIEENTWSDVFWGVDTKKGGLNHLGRILMEVRQYFQTLKQKL